MCKPQEEKKNPDTLRKVFAIIIMVFVLIVSIVCLSGMIGSTISFIENQKTFNKTYSDTASKIAGLSETDRDTIQTSIEYLDKLQQIQKNSTTNDVMSFIYSSLSTILVGLCAGFVAKSYKNVEIANEAVNKASINAETAQQFAKTAKENAESSEKASNKVKNDLETAKKTYEKALLEINKQRNTNSVITIHIEIVHARAALFAHDKITANQRISNIKRLVKKITDEIDDHTIKQLIQELLGLITSVDDYNEYANSLEESYSKTSLLQAIDRYREDLEKSIRHCDHLLVN